MGIVEKFSKADLIKFKSEEALTEARDKKARLRAFYTQQETAKGWVFPNATFSYLEEYKPEGEKRKDKAKESILHEVDPCLWLKGLYEADILPENVTYQIIDNQRFDIEPAGHSIANLFNVMHTHDLFEDFAKASHAELEYVLRRVDLKNPDISPDFKEEIIQYIARATDAITFDYKTFDESGNVIRISKYENDDRQLYTDDLEAVWAAIAAKGPDRLGGTIMRYTAIPDVFTYEQQRAYEEETKQLFFHRQTLENMQARYPELSEYFEVVNANLSIAYRCFSAIISNHRSNPYRSGNTQTARIDIRRFLDTAFIGAGDVESDVAPLVAMLDNYKALAARMSEFENIVTQMDKQLSPKLKEHPTPMPANYSEFEAPPIALQL